MHRLGQRPSCDTPQAKVIIYTNPTPMWEWWVGLRQVTCLNEKGYNPTQTPKVLINAFYMKRTIAVDETDDLPAKRLGKNAYVYEDEPADEPYQSIQAKDLRVGDCCFTSITAPPDYIGKVIGIQKTHDGMHLIQFSNQPNGVKTSQEIAPPEKTYFRVKGRETINPYARERQLFSPRSSSRGGVRRRRKSRRIRHRSRSTKRFHRHSRRRHSSHRRRRHTRYSHYR